MPIHLTPGHPSTDSTAVQKVRGRQTTISTASKSRPTTLTFPEPLPSA